MRQSNLFLASAIVVSAGLVAVFAFAALSPIEDRAADDGLADRVLTPLKMPTVSFGNPSVGPKDAPVTIYAFGDYECEPCALMNDAMVQVHNEFPDQIRVIWKDFPNTATHPLALAAANAARCAGDQGRFWDYHAVLMSTNGTLIEANFVPYATKLGLDTALFQACVDAQRNVPLAERDVLEAKRLNVLATPTLFINERRITGAIGYDQLRTFVTAEMAAKGVTPRPVAPAPAPADAAESDATQP